MRGKKELVLAVVISAALITAGLILSCGDDNGGNGEPDATWEDVCEKLVDCELMDEQDLGICEGWGEEKEEEYDVDLGDILNCTVDARCEHMGIDCWCKEFCEKLIDCEIEYDEDELVFCVTECGTDFVLEDFVIIMDMTMYALSATCQELEE